MTTVAGMLLRPVANHLIIHGRRQKALFGRVRVVLNPLIYLNASRYSRTAPITTVQTGLVPQDKEDGIRALRVGISGTLC
jgi:hypothetical protein